MRPRRGNDHGESLIELLVTLSIMSVAVIAIVGAIATSVRLSDINRRQTNARGYLTTFAETVVARVAAPTTAYIPCANTNGSQYDGFYSPPSGYQAKVTKVEYLNSAGAWTTTGCTLANDTGVQRLTLTVRHTASTVSETILIMIREPCRPGDTC